MGEAGNAVERRGKDAGAQLMAGRQVDSDVAAVVDIGFVEHAVAHQRLQHLVGNGAGYSCHGRDVDGAMRPHRLGHPARYWTLQQRIGLAHRATQCRELTHQRRQDVAKALDRLAVGSFDFVRCAEGFDDQVDRSVLKVQAAIRKSGGNGAHSLPSSSRTLWARSTSSRVTAREA